MLITCTVEMENAISSEDQHVDHRRSIDYSPIISERFLRLIYSERRILKTYGERLILIYNCPRNA